MSTSFERLTPENSSQEGQEIRRILQREFLLNS
jgi:hypothetical protein